MGKGGIKKKGQDEKKKGEEKENMLIEHPFSQKTHFL